MKFDFHTNLGTFPGSSSAISKEHYCSIDELELHINKHQLTHHFCLYERDGYHLLEELSKRLPHVKHYGVQCVFGLTADNATSLEDFTPDVCDPDKSLCVGVKVHSVRGWWQVAKEVEEEHIDITGTKTGLFKKTIIKSTEAGLDYGQFKTMRKLLNKLPRNAIVSLHTQGSLNLRNRGTPLHVGHLASKYPSLKFIINHSGDYGIQSFKPSFMIKNEPGVNGGFADYMLLHTQSKQAIATACLLANDFHNIYLDSSNFCPHKADLYKRLETTKWCIGTDIPFSSENIYNFDKEEQKFIKAGLFCNYKKAVEWIESDVKDIIVIHAAENNLSVIKTTTSTVYRKSITIEQRVATKTKSVKDYSGMLPL